MARRATDEPGARPGRRRRRALAWGVAVVAPAGATLLLFAANGLSRAWRVPASGVVDAAPDPASGAGEVRVMAWNLAKCGFHRGGLSFAPPAEVRARLGEVAALIAAEDPDLVFLSEVVMEAGPAPVDQVRELAELAGFPWWAAGENYRFGLPFFRIRSGNALLSRRPLRALEVQQLAGERPFWNPTNNRRVLWCEVELGSAPLLVGSVRNDSFDLATNELQVEELLERVGERPALLAGDFNAEPEDPPMRLLHASGRFADEPAGAPTHPSHRPRRRIDYVLAPQGWERIEEHVVASELSDHRPVVATFRLP